MNRLAISKKVSFIAIQCVTVAATAFTIIATSSFLASAGTLTPPGPPAATMRTLEEQKPAWNKILPAAQRFVDALDGTAVLDKETGLVWAKTPDSVQSNWQTAVDYCTKLNLGGRMGWRLPTIEELASLIDMSNPGPIKLPVGHPFQNIQNVAYYWSSSAYLESAILKSVIYAPLFIPQFNGMDGKDGFAWPVRGGR